MTSGRKWLIGAVGFKRDGNGVLEDKEDGSNNSVSKPQTTNQKHWGWWLECSVLIDSL